MKKTYVRTRDKNLYEQLNLLQVVDTVVVPNVNKSALSNVLRRINARDEVVRVTYKGGSAVLCRVGVANFNVNLDRGGFF